MRQITLLALLIVGLVLLAPVASAVSPDPDNASGIDLHSNTVVESLVTGVSDITSGNTVQVGPFGGIFRGAVSVEQATQTVDGTTGTQIYTGACVLEGVNFVPDTADDYIEIYNGTSRGTHANCLLDIQGHTADDSKAVNDWTVECTTGIYAFIGASGSAQVRYRIEDQSE